VFGEDERDCTAGLIDVADRVDPRVVLRDPLAAGEPGRAGVARARIDFGETVSHGCHHPTCAASMIAGWSSPARMPKKENPAVGAPGQTLVVIGVYGFKLRPGCRSLPVSGHEPCCCSRVYSLACFSSCSVSSSCVSEPNLTEARAR